MSDALDDHPDEPPYGPPTFVLVHGAWGGSFSWFPVSPGIEAAGGRVYMTSLTGHGERRHLSNSQISLETHITDVVNLIEHHDLNDIHLVGHSYGGMVITGVWDRLRERIGHVVYVDAFVPTDGKSLQDYAPPDRLAGQKAAAAEHGGMIPYMAAAAGQPEDSVHMPQSALTFSMPLRFTRGPLPIDTPKTYILAKANDPSTFHQFAAIARDDPTWRYFEAETGHNVMAEAPEWFVELLTKSIA